MLGGALKAELRLECARCGEPLPKKFSETFDELYEDAVESMDVCGPLLESAALMMPLKPLARPVQRAVPVLRGNLNLKACGCVTGQETGFDVESPFKA